MGKKWDYDVPSKELWEKVYNALKPGAHLLSFFGSRTYHRGVVPIEDAGFDIRDQIMWLYGSGFPKSHNIGKSLDKSAGVKRKVVGKIEGMGYTKSNVDHGAQTRTHTTFDKFSDDAVTPEAKEWNGWGTALKPAHEPIVMARKPFKGTVANNVLEHGVGGINIDESRVPVDYEVDDMHREVVRAPRDETKVFTNNNSGFKNEDNKFTGVRPEGRFPANIIHDGSPEITEGFPKTGDIGGSTARYFYSAKTSKKEKGEGNNHPTVKPAALMKYLCKLVTPKDRIVLDPFMGSGSTGLAALEEGFKFIGIEREEEYFDIACTRLQHFVDNQKTNLENEFSRRSR